MTIPPDIKYILDTINSGTSPMIGMSDELDEMGLPLYEKYPFGFLLEIEYIFRLLKTFTEEELIEAHRRAYNDADRPPVGT